MSVTPFRNWLVPSLGEVLFLGLFLVNLNSGSDLLIDGDTSIHLVTGELVLNTQSIPHEDPYSHTMPGRPWTAHEWLAAIVYASFYRAAGFNGVVLVAMAIISLTLYILYKFLVYRGTNPFLAGSLTLLACSASSVHWLARPHLFSLLLVLVWFILLELYQRDGRRYVKWLPLIMLVWVNLHGAFALGFVLLFIYIAGNLIMAIATPEQRDKAGGRAGLLGLILLGTLAAACVNPSGPGILLFPFRTLDNPVIIDHTAEYLSPNFHTQRAIEMILLVSILVLITARKKLGLIEAAVFALFLHLSLIARRHVPLFAVIATPIVAFRAQDLLERAWSGLSASRWMKKLTSVLERISDDARARERKPGGHAWVYLSLLACLGVALNGGRVGGAQLMDCRLQRWLFPVDAFEFVLANDIQGKVFNQDYWGGYILLKGFPQYKVFYDGRSDMYRDEFFAEYYKVAEGQSGFEKVLDKYGVSWVIFEANAAPCRLLKASDNWKLVFADGVANVFVRDIPENHELIAKYPNVRLMRKGVTIVQ